MRPGVAAAAAAFLLGAACAHVEAPSGGPEDETPPALLVTRPDTLAVVPGWDAPAVLVFDERVSERGVQTAVEVSPRTSAVLVDHRGDEIRVRLREGWRPGTIYHVSVLPGVLDLFGNPVVEPATLVFSTGPEIPETEISGVATDPITGNPEEGIRVEAIRVADSLVYAVPTDSAGGYLIRRVPEGEYRVRAFRDLNRNRALDEFEPRGTATVELAAGAPATQPLAVLMPDSTAATLASAELTDSATVELTFDDFLDPAQELTPGAVQIRSPEGRFVGVSAVAIGPPESPRGGAAAQDTAAAAPLPSRTIVVTLASDARIEPGVEYSVRVRSVRNLAGLEGPAETTLTGPEDTPAPDTPADAPAPADTLASPDTVAPTDTPAPTDTVVPTDTARFARR